MDKFDLNNCHKTLGMSALKAAFSRFESSPRSLITANETHLDISRVIRVIRDYFLVIHVIIIIKTQREILEREREIDREKGYIYILCVFTHEREVNAQFRQVRIKCRAVLT